MPPLNQAERRKAFLNFLIFFSVTITIIIIVIFFSIEVPFIDNQRLRKQVGEFQDQKELTRSLHTEINQITDLITTLDSRDVNQAAINAQIDSKVGAINELVRSSNVADSQSVNYYSMLTRSLLTLRNLKKDLGESKNKEQEAARLNLEIESLKRQLAEKDQTIRSLTLPRP